MNKSKEELLSELEKLKAEFHTLEEKIRTYDEGLNSLNTRQWIPEKEGMYWCMDNNGWAFPSNWEDDTSDRSRLEIGNVFKTEKEAKFEYERLKILAIMKKYSKPFVEDRCNYYIGFNHREETIQIYFTIDCNHGIPFFESWEIAQKVIDEIGEDRLKKYYFRME